MLVVLFPNSWGVFLSYLGLFFFILQSYFIDVFCENNEMLFVPKSKSKTDKRNVMMQIDENSGRFDCDNKMGEDVVRIGVGNVGMGEKFGYLR